MINTHLMTAQVNENENRGRKVIENLFNQIKEVDKSFKWKFTEGQYDVFDGMTKRSIFDVKYRDFINKYTGKMYDTIYLSAHKVDEMNRIASANKVNSLYMMVDNRNDNILVADLKDCDKWKRSFEWMQTNNLTHEKGWVDVYSIPKDAFNIYIKGNDGKYNI